MGSESGIKGEIDDEQDAGGFEDYPEELRPISYDTDYDGLPNWWEDIRGTDPRTRTRDYKETNADMEGDGYTELERYLDFMAQPHVWLAPAAQTVVDVKKLFAGYTNHPAFSVATAGTGVTASLTDGLLSIQAGDAKALATLTLTVTDADNAGYERRLCVAVTDNATVANAISHIEAESPTATPLYDLTGRRLSAPYAKGIYITGGRKVIIK